MLSLYYCFFFFNDTATTEIYTLSLHDALPISGREPCGNGSRRRPAVGHTSKLWKLGEGCCKIDAAWPEGGACYPRLPGPAAAQHVAARLRRGATSSRPYRANRGPTRDTRSGSSREVTVRESISVSGALARPSVERPPVIQGKPGS